MYASGDDPSEHHCNFDLAFLHKWPTLMAFVYVTGFMKTILIGSRNEIPFIADY